MHTTRWHPSVLISAAAFIVACGDPPTSAATHALRTSPGGVAAPLICQVQIAPQASASAANPGVSAGSSSASVTCRPSGNAAAQSVTGGNRTGNRTMYASDSILEDQGTDVSIQFDSVQIVNNVLTLARTLTVWTSVSNMLSVDIGTSDGSTPAANGTRVFFTSGPSTLSGVGVVTIGNATGTGTFTATGQQYFQYNGIIAPGSSSGTIGWQFNSVIAVNSFTFGIGVDAIVP
jgi:hypothetical protein